MELKDQLEKLDSLYADGNLPEAEKMLNNWLEDARLMADDASRLTLLNELMGLYRTTGRASQAAECAGEALGLVDRLNLTGTAQHGTTLLNAATAYSRAGDYDRALELYAAAGNLFRQNGLDGSYQMASLFNNISSVYEAKGDAGKALEYLESALEIVSGLDDCAGEAAVTRISIAYALMRLERLKEAADTLQEVYLYFASEEGSRDPHFAALLAASGELAVRNHDYAEAIDDYQKALKETKDRYGENDYCRMLEKNIAFVQGTYGKIAGIPFPERKLLRSWEES